MTKFSGGQKDSQEGSDPRPKGLSEHCTAGAEEIHMNRAEDGSEREVKEMGTEEEKEDQDELSPQQSFSNYDEPAMPFDEPPMAYDDPPMGFEDQPIACDEPPMAFDEPPMAFNDSWGFGDCRVELQKPRFSLRLESSGDGTSLNSSNYLLGPHASPNSLPAQGLHQPTAADRTPPAVSPEPQPNTSALDPKLWDSWEEEEEEEGGGSARPLSQRLGAVAPAKRVAQLRTPGNLLDYVILSCMSATNNSMPFLHTLLILSSVVMTTTPLNPKVHHITVNLHLMQTFVCSTHRSTILPCHCRGYAQSKLGSLTCRLLCTQPWQ